LLVVTLYSSADRPSWPTAWLFSLGLTLFSLLLGCGSGDGGGLDITPGGVSPSSGGAGASYPTGSVSRAWDPVPDPSVYAYFVHYGKQSAGQSGSCHYTQSTFVGPPSATITGLDPNTQYFFAVSAYNDVESACSSEVSTITQAAA